MLYRKPSDPVKEECDSSLVTHHLRNLECRLEMVEIYTPSFANTGGFGKTLDIGGGDTVRSLKVIVMVPP